MSEPPVIDGNAENLKAQRRKARRFGVMSWLFATLVLALALVGTAPYWAPSIASILPWGAAPQGDQLSQLQQRLDAAQARLDALAPGDAQLAARLDALEKEAAGDAAALDDMRHAEMLMPDFKDALAAMNRRLAALEAQRGGDTPDRMLFLALSQLEAAAATSRPFLAELKSAEALAQSRPALAARLAGLDADAVSGIPSAADLANRFSESVAPDLLRQAPATSSADESWAQRIWAKLASLVVIRRLDRGPGGAPADPVTAAVQAAQADLAKGDLAGAVNSVEALPDEARAPAKDWLALAHKRLAAEAALAGAAQDVAASLASPPGAKSP